MPRTLMPALLVLALLSQAPFALDTLRPPAGPEVLWHHHSAPLIALRLSIPLPPDLPPGAAELLQELARPAAVREADRFGAAVEMRVVGAQATVAVTGPAAAFDALVGILRGTLSEPELSVEGLRSARARAEDRVLASLERPEPRLRTLLHASLGGPSAGGPAVDGLDPETIRGLVARLHRAERLRVVLVADLPSEIVKSAFSDWPRFTQTIPRPTTGPLPPLPPPQAHNAWTALGYPLQAHPAVVAVAAQLVARRVRAAGLLGGAAEAWNTRYGDVLVVLGGAPRDAPDVTGAALITDFPTADRDDDPSALARFARRLIAEAAALAGPDAVADAAATLRRAILIDARTPAGRAEVLGRWATLPGAPGASVHDVLDGLEGVTLRQVRAALGEALAAAPVLVEVRP